MSKTSKNGESYKPILRWAGGKNWLLKDIYQYVPEKFNNYHEPFLGGGSVFFYLNPKKKAYLSDVNQDLINAFCHIRDNLPKLVSLLKTYINTEAEYYKVRDQIYEKNSIERATQFIFLNRTCFNGIYRVNNSGKYNVPYGFKTYTNLFDFDRYRVASERLQGVTLSCSDFECSLKHIRSGDLVFLDPPYIVNHENNGFVKYNEPIFSWKDQERLADFIKKIKERKAFYILTNAKHESVNKLFGSIDSPTSLERASVIGGAKAMRGLIGEYVFSNGKNL